MGKLFVFLPTGQLAKGENQFIKVVCSIYFLFVSHCSTWLRVFLCFYDNSCCVPSDLSYI